MEIKFLFFITFLFLFGFVINGDPVSEMKADEENESECFHTQHPEKTQDCISKQVHEDDDKCCLFEIENHKEEIIKVCSGLTAFQYDHIKLYVKEKMDELLYRDFHIHCDSFILKISYLFLLFFLYI